MKQGVKSVMIIFNTTQLFLCNSLYDKEERNKCKIQFFFSSRTLTFLEKQTTTEGYMRFISKT